MNDYSIFEGLRIWQDARTGALPAVLMLLTLPAFLILPARFAPPLFLIASLSFLSLLAGVVFAAALVAVALLGHLLTEAVAAMQPGNARRVAFAAVWLLLHAAFFAAFELPVPTGIRQMNPGPHNVAGMFLFFSGIALTFFRIVAYLHDRVRRGLPRLSPFDFLLYNFWFPQLLHGPLERPADAVEKLKAARAAWTPWDLWMGGRRIALAFFLAWLVWSGARNLAAISKAKPLPAPSTAEATSVVGPGFAALQARVSDSAEFLRNEDIASLANFFSAPEKMPLWLFLLVLHLITFGLYWIEITWAHLTLGVSRVFGFVGSEAYNFPLLSASPREWWTRWNITLSQWLRDYCFTPIGGARRNFHLNMSVTFLYCGILHGLQWRFIVWGVWSAITIAGGHWLMERIKERLYPDGKGGIKKRRKPANAPLSLGERLWLYTRRLLTFHWAAISGVIIADQNHCGLRVLQYYCYLLAWPIRVWL
ncbi:MAG: MBOAT family O-acyltransferase [Phycisphaerae bacterium]|nr:MBOAT family O-acyltransferase [Phycisphaerae bacterium]